MKKIIILLLIIQAHAIEIMPSSVKENNNDIFVDKYEYQLLRAVYGRLREHMNTSDIMIIYRNLLDGYYNYNIDPLLCIAAMKVETDYNNNARGLAGELGILQFMPATAREECNKLGIKYYYGIEKDYNVSIKIWFHYMSMLTNYFKDISRALVAYNAGIGRVSRLIERVSFNICKKSIYKTRLSYDAKIRRTYEKYKTMA